MLCKTMRGPSEATETVERDQDSSSKITTEDPWSTLKVGGVFCSGV